MRLPPLPLDGFDELLASWSKFKRSKPLLPFDVYKRQCNDGVSLPVAIDASAEDDADRAEELIEFTAAEGDDGTVT